MKRIDNRGLNTYFVSDEEKFNKRIELLTSQKIRLKRQMLEKKKKLISNRCGIYIGVLEEIVKKVEEEYSSNPISGKDVEAMINYIDFILENYSESKVINESQRLFQGFLQKIDLEDMDRQLMLGEKEKRAVKSKLNIIKNIAASEISLLKHIQKESELKNIIQTNKGDDQNGQHKR